MREGRERKGEREGKAGEGRREGRVREGREGRGGDPRVYL